jgi:hypothetical protein
MLGGKCRHCGNENFYELEIDHKYNDGDGERKIYTRTETRYLNNPVRAKQRLQVLCKTCHEDKHYNQDHPIAPKIIGHLHTNVAKSQLFMDCLKELEGSTRHPVKEDVLIERLAETGQFQDEYNTPKQYIIKLLREASIYESLPGSYNRV